MSSSNKMGWLRHVLTFLSVLIFLIGCFVIGYMCWVLASSVSVSRFLDGSLIFTYVVIGLGFCLFFSGLLGWVGGASASPCLVRLFTVTLAACIIAEIGGIITLNVVKLKMSDILKFGWDEVNQETRNIVQNQLDCCGWNGPKDFAYNNDPIDESCYERNDDSNNSRIWPRPSSFDGQDDSNIPAKKMKQNGCGIQLHDWFEDNKLTWVTILASLIALQVMCIVLAVYILTRVKRMRKLYKSRSKRRLYDSSSDGSADYRI